MSKVTIMGETDLGKNLYFYRPTRGRGSRVSDMMSFSDCLRLHSVGKYIFSTISFSIAEHTFIGPKTSPFQTLQLLPVALGSV